MKHNFRKGFTLIELLVVIAIIALLSSVVLASLNTARGKGANAAIKSNLANIRAQAEMSYDTNSSYTGVCTQANIAAQMTSANAAAGVAAAVSNTLATVGSLTQSVCHVAADNSAWAAAVPLKVAEGSSLYWCVDSTGTSAARINVLGASATVCPAS